MKLKYGSIIIVLAILAAVAFAGCTTTTSPSPSTPAATTTGATTAPGTATTAPASGGLTSLKAIDYSKIHWFEYKMTSSGDTPVNALMKMEYGVDYKGTKANKMTMTTDMKQDDVTMTTTMEYYVDAANNNNLGGHMKTMQGTQVISEMDLPASTGGTSTGSQDPLSSAGDAALTNAGPDVVTVPAYTGAATKYTYTDKDGNTNTVWMASSIPIPVKMVGKYSGQTSTMELTGWG